MTAYHDMIRDQLDEGLRELHHLANQLMHEIATEVWRTAAVTSARSRASSSVTQPGPGDPSAHRAHRRAFPDPRRPDGGAGGHPEHGRRGLRRTREQIARSVGALGEVPRERPRRDGDRPASGRAHRADARSPSRPSPTATHDHRDRGAARARALASSSRTRPPASTRARVLRPAGRRDDGHARRQRRGAVSPARATTRSPAA